MEFIKTFEAHKETDHLSGIVLLIEGKILLIHPKKFKNQNDKWSVPKGHIEGKPLKSALKELKEEAGIKLDKNYDYKFSINYSKGSKKKMLKLFVYDITSEEVSKYIKSDLELKKKAIKKIHKKEIHDVGFFTIADAKKILEKGQRKLINKLTS